MFDQQELDEMEELVEDLVFNAQCRIYAEGENFPEIDPDTLQPIEAAPTLKYEGPCMIEPTSRNYERAFAVGETKQGTRTYNCRVRKSFSDPAINDTVRIYEVMDPALSEDYVFTVIDPQVSSTATQRILAVELTLGH